MKTLSSLHSTLDLPFHEHSRSVSSGHRFNKRIIPYTVRKEAQRVIYMYISDARGRTKDEIYFKFSSDIVLHILEALDSL